MLFKNYFNSLSDILQARLKGYEHDKLNPADKGELCEIFIKDFLQDSLSDNFKIFRGGKIVNSLSIYSNQIDIVLCSKRTLKIFSDKGIYPTETVKGVFSITSTLDIKKLDEMMKGFNTIPKTNYHVDFHQPFTEEFRQDTQRIFENLIPFTCIFAFYGRIDANWVKHILKWIEDNKPNPSLTPDCIVVNKKGMIYKQVEKTGENKMKFTYNYMDLENIENCGVCFSHILYSLYNLSHEELYMFPDYTPYFNNDLLKPK